jgi:hypothetical protein
LIRVIMYPGMLVQMITTKRPTDDMIEVAITSMEEALVADGNEVPAGSTEFDRGPMRIGKPADELKPPDSVGAASPGETPPLQ